MNDYIWQGKPWQAFKSFAIIFSFVVNFILVIVLLIAGPLILPIVSDIAVPIVDDLDRSFVEMGDAQIVRTIQVDDQLGISFTLPLEDQTNVVLAEDVRLLRPATVLFPGNASVIFGQVDLVLPAGTILPVHLQLDVPVSQTVPVKLAVQVEIPLEETDLGTPFERLEARFGPLNQLLTSLPSSNEQFMETVQRAVFGGGGE
jgi:hypothetical protein